MNDGRAAQLYLTLQIEKANAVLQSADETRIRMWFAFRAAEHAAAS
jgi:hypothetical protein